MRCNALRPVPVLGLSGSRLAPLHSNRHRQKRVCTRSAGVTSLGAHTAQPRLCPHIGLQADRLSLCTMPWRQRQGRRARQDDRDRQGCRLLDHRGCARLQRSARTSTTPPRRTQYGSCTGTTRAALSAPSAPVPLTSISAASECWPGRMLAPHQPAASVDDILWQAPAARCACERRWARAPVPRQAVSRERFRALHSCTGVRPL